MPKRLKFFFESMSNTKKFYLKLNAMEMHVINGKINIDSADTEMWEDYITGIKVSGKQLQELKGECKKQISLNKKNISLYCSSQLMTPDVDDVIDGLLYQNEQLNNILEKIKDARS